MFFFADAIFGTKEISKKMRDIRVIREGWNLGLESTKVKAR
jgi:hypothetical protein